MVTNLLFVRAKLRGFKNIKNCGPAQVQTSFSDGSTYLLSRFMSRFMTRVARDIPLLQHINQHEVLLVDHRRDKHFEPWPNPEMFCVKPAASLICSRYNARGSLIIIAFVVKHMKIF